MNFSSFLNPLHSSWKPKVACVKQDAQLMDQLVRLVTFVTKGYLNGKNEVAIFFDVEKTHDTVWKYRNMKNVYEMVLRGRLTLFFSKLIAKKISSQSRDIPLLSL